MRRAHAVGVILIALTSAWPETAWPEKYRVKEGDTLASIAADHGMTYQSLGYHNGLDDVDLIYIGQVIDIPEDPVDPPPEVRWRYTSAWAQSYAKLRQQAVERGLLSVAGSRPAPSGIIPVIPDKLPLDLSRLHPKPDARASGICAQTLADAAAHGDMKLTYDGPLTGLQIRGTTEGVSHSFRAYLGEDGLVVDRSSTGESPITMSVPDKWRSTVAASEGKPGTVWTGGATSGHG